MLSRIRPIALVLAVLACEAHCSRTGPLSIAINTNKVYGASPVATHFERLVLRGGGELLKSVGTKAEFDEILKSSGDKLVVVDFTATWCGPCQRIAPVLDVLASENPNVVFIKVMP